MDGLLFVILFHFLEIMICKKDVQNSTDTIEVLLQTGEAKQKTNKELDMLLEYCREDSANITATAAPPQGSG